MSRSRVCVCALRVLPSFSKMSEYDNIDLLDMAYSEEQEEYLYACPCGDNFFITLDDLFDGEETATCPSCSLVLHVKYDIDEVEKIHPE